MSQRNSSKRAARDALSVVSGTIETLSAGIVRGRRPDDTDALTFGTVYTPSTSVGARVSSHFGKGLHGTIRPTEVGFVKATPSQEPRVNGLPRKAKPGRPQ